MDNLGNVFVAVRDVMFPCWLWRQFHVYDVYNLHDPYGYSSSPKSIKVCCKCKKVIG